MEHLPFLGLYRQKWMKHHADGATYGEETLDKAIESTECLFSAATSRL